MANAIKQTIKEFILDEFLPGEDPDELTESTPLITGGILDSIATLKLVMFLEERYGDHARGARGRHGASRHDRRHRAAHRRQEALRRADEQA